ncbi:hypothetical protein ACFO3U_13305 [Flavobacterium ponti]|uniref:DUF2383 domain-containing protein n=1 Tax=Flavobacterium ponti TaxID=665133 RepID=A0ABV9P9J3_9FLAO
MESNTVINHKIQGIIAKAITTEKVYKNFAENVTNQSLKKYLNSKVLQRNSLIKELKTFLMKSQELTFEADINISNYKQTNSSKNDDQTILEKSISIEKDILNHLEDILDKEYITMDLRNILSNHYNSIKIEFESIKTLDDIHKAYS